MKSGRAMLLVLPFALALLAHAAPPNSMPTVAVFDFEAKDDASGELGAKVAESLFANLWTYPNLVLIERDKLKEALRQEELPPTGGLSPDNAAKIGKLTGAEVLITGRVFTVGQDLVLAARVMDLQRRRVFGEVIHGALTAPVPDTAAGLARQIAAVLVDKGSIAVSGIGDVFDISFLDRIPQAVMQVRPSYPAKLRAARVSGQALVDFIVDTNGDVRNAFVASATAPEFGAAAVQAVIQWKFRPGQRGAVTVNTHMQVPIVFAIN
jgi:TonB family protein